MKHAYRASILHFLDDPDRVGDNDSHQYWQDGALVVSDGKVVAVGDAEAVLPTLDPDCPVTEYPNSLILPGLIDTHVHYPQLEMIAAYGEQLLEWLNTYTFPTETRFSDADYARSIADRFLQELLRNGTTTALVFGTSHMESVDAFFEASEALNLRMIAGKVLMDRNAPDALLDTAESGYQQSRELIQRWHNRGRQRYAITPRFSPTSTPEQLQRAGELLAEFPGVYMHTHLSENIDEIAWVDELFPDCDSYLDTYDQAGLLGPRSVFAHCVHLQDAEWSRLAETGSNIAHCPSSNLFLGSGLFPLRKAVEHGVSVGLGTDVGAGSTFSILGNMADAYKVQQLSRSSLPPLKAYYLATLGGARSLDLQDLIGNFERGREADFVVLDKCATPLLQHRTTHCNTLEEELFVLAMLGDDRCIASTFSAGVLVHQRD